METHCLFLQETQQRREELQRLRWIAPCYLQGSQTLQVLCRRTLVTYSPRQLRHIDFISQLTTDFRFVRGEDNTPADALSRNICATSLIDYAAIAADQVCGEELQQLKENSALSIKRIQLPASQVHLYADVSTDTIRPYLPKNHRYPLFRQLHDHSHLGV